MGRNAKSVDTMSKHLTKEEYESRKEAEQQIRGNTDKIKPDKNLTDNQVLIFDYIVNELAAAELLGNLDIFILNKFAIAVDRINYIEDRINKNPALALKREVQAFKKLYDTDFKTCISELPLSPQSRAKISNINVNSQKNKDDELMKILKGE